MRLLRKQKQVKKVQEVLKEVDDSGGCGDGCCGGNGGSCGSGGGSCGGGGSNETDGFFCKITIVITVIILYRYHLFHILFLHFSISLPQ